MGKNGKNSVDAQAAMEYLTTYIWMLLIVAVMLLALYGFGLFSLNVTGPRAQPGACQETLSGTVVEPSLVGVCNNELPKFTMAFHYGPGTWTFNCADIGSCVGFPPVFTPGQKVCNATIVGWSYDEGLGPLGGAVSLTYNSWYAGSGAQPATPALAGVYSVFNGVPSDGAIDVEYNDSILRFEVRNYSSRNQIFKLGSFKFQWVQTAVELDNGHGVGYIDGQQVTPNPNGTPNVGCLSLQNGTIGTWDRNFYGRISNIQIYNTSLSGNEIYALYLEGIGGEPIDLNYLVAWYPLNLNTNDYSDHGKNGYIYNITDSNVWSENYTLP